MVIFEAFGGHAVHFHFGECRSQAKNRPGTGSPQVRRVVYCSTQQQIAFAKLSALELLIDNPDSSGQPDLPHLQKFLCDGTDGPIGFFKGPDRAILMRNGARAPWETGDSVANTASVTTGASGRFGRHRGYVDRIAMASTLVAITVQAKTDIFSERNSFGGLPPEVCPHVKVSQVDHLGGEIRPL